MHGGQIVKYQKHTKRHVTWVPLKQHTMDCGPNCFALLRYCDQETSQEMARRTPHGIYQEDVSALLDQAYGVGHDWTFISKWSFDHPSVGDPEGIDTYLGMNEATIAYSNEHYFIVQRDQEGYHAIDAQTGKTTPLLEYMNYEDSDSFYIHELEILTSRSVIQTPTPKVTMKMVKIMFPLPEEIRRYETARKRRTLSKAMFGKSHTKRRYL